MAYAPGSAGTRTPARTTTSRMPAAGRNGRNQPPAAPQKMTRKGTATFLAGLGIGVALGAALGLLYAPRAGAETRQAIRRRGKKIRNRASDAWEDLRLELAATKRALARKRRDVVVENAGGE